MISETVNNFRKLFTIPDLGQKVRKHIKGHENSTLGHIQKAFTIQLNRIEKGFYLAFRIHYFDLQSFK